MNRPKTPDLEAFDRACGLHRVPAADVLDKLTANLERAAYGPPAPEHGLARHLLKDIAREPVTEAEYEAAVAELREARLWAALSEGDDDPDNPPPDEIHLQRVQSVIDDWRAQQDEAGIDEDPHRCEHCSGTGRDAFEDEECSYCHGTGETPVPRW